MAASQPAALPSWVPACLAAASWLASELQLPATELPFSAAELQLSAVTSAWSSRVFARSGTSITDGTPHVPASSNPISSWLSGHGAEGLEQEQISKSFNGTLQICWGRE
ncbi:hypothetical protein XENTR_v10013182 [Xenopus tropicalis]|nr:hypothetical protein XENTR_v10013182 [Xenopus tropicalis]